jgi:hypothetical protein
MLSSRYGSRGSSSIPAWEDLESMTMSRLAAIALVGALAAAVAAVGMGVGVGSAATTCKTVKRVTRGTHLVWRRRSRTIRGHYEVVWVRVRVRYTGVSSKRVCSTTTTTTAAQTTTASTSTVMTPYSHVVVLIEENNSGSAILGSGQAPYLAGLAAQAEPVKSCETLGRRI